MIKFFNYYLTVCSSLMIIYVFVSLINIFTGSSLGSPANAEQHESYGWFFHGIGYLYIFCLFNVIVCGVSGIMLLLERAEEG